MGGSFISQGNLSSCSEFNFGYDFIAAKIVLNNFKNIIITPWESSSELFIRDHNIKQFSTNILGRNKQLNDIMFSFVSLIISKFTADKNGTQLCDLYSVINSFNYDGITKFSICKLDIIIDSVEMFGMLYVKSRRVIEEKFKDYIIKNNNNTNTHILVEEFDELTIMKEYEDIFTL